MSRQSNKHSIDSILTSAESCRMSPLIPISERTYSRTGFMAAFRHNSLRSEPESPFVFCSKASISRDLSSGIPVSNNSRTRLRASLSGTWIEYRFGIRRKMAGSISLGRFVAEGGQWRQNIRDLSHNSIIHLPHRPKPKPAYSLRLPDHPTTPSIRPSSSTLPRDPMIVAPAEKNQSHR